MTETATHIPAKDGLAVIELFGLPGVGKSAATRGVCARLREAGLDITCSEEWIGDHLSPFQRNAARIHLILRELPSTLRYVPRFLRIAAIKQPVFSFRFKALYNFLTVASMVLRARRRGDMLLLDQGIAQAIWSLMMFSTVDTQDLVAFEGTLFSEWVTHLVVLEAPSEIVAARLAHRTSKHSRMQDGSSQTRWGQAETVVDEVLAYFNEKAEAGDLSILTFEAGDIEIDALAQQISDRILRLLSA